MCTTYGMQGDLTQGLTRMLNYFHPDFALVSDTPVGRHCLFPPSGWFPYMEMKSPVPFFSGILWLHLQLHPKAPHKDLLMPQLPWQSGG